MAIQGSETIEGHGGDRIGQAGEHVAKGEEQGDGQEDNQEAVEVSILEEVITIIVKVQISKVTSDGIERVMIYNEDHSILHEDTDPKQLAKIHAIFDSMEFDGKAFFNAHLEGTLIILDELAQWQEW